MSRYGSLSCVCCPEQCTSFCYYPSCDPLHPQRPHFRTKQPRFSNNLPVETYLAPDGRYRKVKKTPSAAMQLDLFGGVQ